MAIFPQSRVKIKPYKNNNPMATILELEKELNLEEPFEAEQIRKVAFEEKGLRQARIVENYLIKSDPAKTIQILTNILENGTAEYKPEFIEMVTGIRFLIQDLLNTQSDYLTTIQNQYENELSWVKQMKHN